MNKFVDLVRELKKKTLEYKGDGYNIIVSALGNNFQRRVQSTWTVLLARYSGPFLKLTAEELRQLDQKTKNLMTMHKGCPLRYA